MFVNTIKELFASKDIKTRAVPLTAQVAQLSQWPKIFLLYKTSTTNERRHFADKNTNSFSQDENNQLKLF